MIFFLQNVSFFLFLTCWKIVCSLHGLSFDDIVDSDYCNVFCDGITATLCQYRGAVANCRGPPGRLGNDLSNLIMKLHNEKRNSVAAGKESGLPNAKNMAALAWDDELEYIAHRWAVQCQTTLHDDCRKSQDDYYLGQNIYYHGDIKGTLENFEKEITAGVKSFIDEQKKFKWPSDGKYKFTPKRPRFPQLIWGQTSKIGCGYSYLFHQHFDQATNQTITDSTDFTLVCNYYMDGLIDKNFIYKEGKPCSDCGKAKCHKIYTSLCDMEPARSSTLVAQKIIVLLLVARAIR